MIVTVFSLEYDLFTQFWGKKKKKKIVHDRKLSPMRKPNCYW